ncbi:MAG: threonylcarbamoyl-AMP synthase [Myxococcales bacterium]|nr:threonylcarbamoyl-AMP synthase [Myxococcales bacterium]
MSRVIAATELALAAAALRAGEVVAFPTETVYGLGALALDRAALGRIFAMKGRPATHPLIAHVRDAAQAATLTTAWDARASALAARFWPGPLTLVLPRAPSVPPELSGGKPTVAMRAPAHPIAQELLSRVGQPLAAPSANRYQSLSPTTAAHVAGAFADEELLIVDGGPCAAGLESTVLDLTTSPPAVLRPGPLSLAELRALVPDVVLGAAVVADEAARHSPGQDAIHYAPRARLLLCDRTIALARRDAALVLRGRGDAARPDAVVLPDDAAGYGRALYAALHALDDAGAIVIAVESPPDDEAWLAVADRLRRAAAK